jgi:hypothetical protein
MLQTDEPSVELDSFFFLLYTMLCLEKEKNKRFLLIQILFLNDSLFIVVCYFQLQLIYGNVGRTNKTIRDG